MQLMVRHYVVRAPYLLHIERTLTSRRPACYEFKYCQIVTTNIPRGQKSISTSSLWNGIKPNFLMLFFLENKTLVGDKTSDPLKFSHNNLSSVSFMINNENLPRDAYTMEFETKSEKYAMIFNALHTSLGIGSENISTSVNLETFLTHHFFVAHDCTSFSNALTTLLDPLEIVNVGFTATFSKAIGEPMTALLLMLLPRKIEISDKREVSVIY